MLDHQISMNSTIPLVGSHNIPYQIPQYYSNKFDGYSIFGSMKNGNIEVNARLIDHSGTLR